MKLDTSKFEKAVADLASNSKKTDAELITSMGRILVRSIVYNTPVKTGHLRAGWWPAWNGLQMNGQPSRRSMGTSKKGEYVVDGLFVDNRRANNPSIAVENLTRAIRRGRAYRYGNLLNFGPGKNHGFLDRGIDEATQKIVAKAIKEYTKNLRRANRG
jgi:hypothetical protein